MKPEEQKAKELVKKFLPISRMDCKDKGNQLYNAKQCALTCVDEIMGIALCEDCNSAVEVYWQDVKQEINKQ